MKHLLSVVLVPLLLVTGAFVSVFQAASQNASAQMVTTSRRVLFVDMKMAILPGTAEYLKEAIEFASTNQIDLIVVQLGTPGGMITTTQDMVQDIFKSSVPIAVYVGPSGASATSAGVFITMAAHIAAMAPGTSIGAAHPVGGGGEDIKGDMGKKVENMAAALARSISEKRGRNSAWAERAVKKSSSLTVDEAIRKGVVDIKAEGLDELMVKLEGREVLVGDVRITLTGFKNPTVVNYSQSLRLKVLNFLSDPTVAGILWLGATTGLAVELYHPGLILPGVVGAVCLVLALISMQILPLSTGAIVLILVGVLLALAESFVPSGILGVGGIVAILVGMLYLVDTGQAPGLHVQIVYIIPFLIIFAVVISGVVWSLLVVRRHKPIVGYSTLLGREGEVTTGFESGIGAVRVGGEIWRAECSESLDVGSKIIVKGKNAGLTLLVELVPNNRRE
jgi:membrane-bound serine protease (ClpP class)